MRILVLVTALIFFGVGYWFGRESQKQTEVRRCPRCGHRRLHWCRGCGIHFDDEDQPLSHRDYERLTATDGLFEESGDS